MKRLLFLTIAFIAVSLYAQTEKAELSIKNNPQYAPELKAGDVAPEISAPTPEGKIVSLSDFKGKYVVIDFWASWCGDCRREIPALKQLYSDTKDWKLGTDKRALVFLSVSFDYKRENWLNMLEKENFPWPQISNLKNTREDPIYKDYKMHWIPTFFVVSPEGKIVGAAITAAELRTVLEELHK